MGNAKKEYDMQLQSQAVTRLLFRAAVAVYVGYMGVKVLLGTLQGQSPIPTPLAVLIALVFVGGAVVFCLYAWREYRKALAAAELKDEPPQDEPVD